MLLCLNIHGHHAKRVFVLQLEDKLHDREEYLKSLKQIVISYKRRDVSSVAFKFGQPRRPGEVFHANVLHQHFLVVFCSLVF